jgi:hypothetical protein
MPPNEQNGSSPFQEFYALLKRQGIELPVDRAAGAFAVHLELSRMAALLRGPRVAESEPASIFSLPALLPELAGR